MRIAGTKSCSLVNGPGVRYVIFMQGCPHHCEGCHNPETWDFLGGHKVHNLALLSDIAKHPHIDGITISGGEPFVQQEVLVDFLRRFKTLTRFNGKAWDIWIYTGYEYDQIKDTELAQMADVLVTGKFEKDKPTEPGTWYGSTNQQVIHIKKD